MDARLRRKTLDTSSERISRVTFKRTLAARPWLQKMSFSRFSFFCQRNGKKCREKVTSHLRASKSSHNIRTIVSSLDFKVTRLDDIPRKTDRYKRGIKKIASMNSYHHRRHQFICRSIKHLPYTLHTHTCEQNRKLR